jgi:hypothetical protein
MNKVITDIEDQACAYASAKADYTDEDWSYQFDRDVTLKFTELMVHECCKVITERGFMHHPYEIAKMVKAHFGVES